MAEFVALCAGYPFLNGQFSQSNVPPAPIMSSIRRILRDDSAIAVTEYGLLIALIAVLLIAVVTIFGSNIASWFSNKTNKITSF